MVHANTRKNFNGDVVTSSRNFNNTMMRNKQCRILIPSCARTLAPADSCETNNA